MRNEGVASKRLIKYPIIIWFMNVIPLCFDSMGVRAAVFLFSEGLNILIDPGLAL